MSAQPAEQPSSQPEPPPERRPWLTNLILLGLVAGLGVWVWGGEPELKTTDQLHAEKKRLFPHFRGAQVVRLELERGAERVLLVRDGVDAGEALAGQVPTSVGWRMEAPVADAADGAEVMKLLSSVEWAEFEREDGAAFSEVAVRARFVTADGRSVSFELGAERPGKVVALRVAGREAIYHVEREFARTLQREAWFLRDKRMFGIADGDIASLRLESRGESPHEVTLAAVEGGWRVGGPEGQHADGVQVNAFVDAVQDLHASGVVADNPKAELLATQGLDDPEFRLTITAQAGDARTLELGTWVEGRPAERYARLVSRPGVVYRVNVSPFLPQVELPAQAWLHPRLFPVDGSVQGAVGALRARFRDDAQRDFVLQRRKTGDLTADWMFELPGVPAGGPPVIAEKQAAEALVRELLAVDITKRLPAGQDLEALGLEDPALEIELREGERWHRVRIGRSRPGKPGQRHVAFLQGETPADGVWIYLARLDELPISLREAPLELRRRSVFKAYHLDVRAMRLERADGSIAFIGTKINPNPGNDRTFKLWQVQGQPLAKHDELETFIKTFDDVQAERFEALVNPETRRRYGLDQPSRLVVVVSTWDEGQGTLVDQERVLELGDRVGNRIYALPRPHGHAIALLDATFVDRLLRGFTPGTLLFETRKWDAKALRITRRGADGEETLELKKELANWKRGRTIMDYQPIERVLDGFAQVELRHTEPASPERLAETGLTAPTWEIAITVQTSAATKPTEHVLLIGRRAGERDLWATTPGNAQIGQLFDAGFLEAEKYFANPVEGARRIPEPLISEPDEGHEGHDH